MMNEEELKIFLEKSLLDIDAIIGGLEETSRRRYYFRGRYNALQDVYFQIFRSNFIHEKQTPARGL